MHGFRVFTIIATLGGAAFALQVSRSARPDGKQVPVERAVEVEGTDELSVAAGTGGECKEIGAFDESFTFANRYRGNVYRIDKSVSLTAVQMRLGMDGARTVHATIHQKQENGDWTRYPEGSADYVLEIGAAQAGSFTNPTFRAVPFDPPVELLEGHDYAIGFAWSESIRFGKDIFRTYPQSTPADFGIGTVRGNVAINFSSSPLPMADMIEPFESSQGAYAMRLCLTGACCFAQGGVCLDLGENGCLEAFGQFTASGVTCAELEENDDHCPLSRGACCHADACDFVNEYACAEINGTWSREVACEHPTIEPCEPRGGCCFTDGECQENHTVGTCSSLGGSYRGDNVACSAFPPCSAGACCNGTFCSFELTVEDCEDPGCPQCVFAGPGTNCAGNPCVPTGACCNPTTGACQNGITKTSCEDTGGSFRGAGSTCTTLSPPCGRGACCIDGIGCQDANGAGMSRTFCVNTLGGTFRDDGSTCDTINPRCPGVCCWHETEKDTCISASEPESCESAVFGTFLGYEVSCTSNPCVPVTSSNGQACCLPHGECVNVYAATDAETRQLCEVDLRGVFTAGMQCDQIPCDAVQPTGSCCDRVMYHCEDDVVREDCLGYPRQWTLNTDCEQLANPCEPRGACCDRANLVCHNAKLASECPHEWTASITCDLLETPCAETGGCCIGEVCQVSTFSSCFLRGGAYLGDDSTCDEGTCTIPTGACCINFECFIRTRAQCLEQTGTYRNDGSTCAGDICDPTGACCVDEDCSIATEVACTGEYQGDGSTCGVDTCFEIGACCDIVNGGCSIQRAENCTGAGFTYVGPDTTCDGDPCAVGGCCDTTCTCIDDSQRFRCEAASGQFFEAQACDSVTCPVKIAGSDFPDCAIDAREHPPQPGALAPEIDSFTITMSCASLNTVAEDFVVENVPPIEPPAEPSAIDHVMIDDTTTVHVMLTAPIPPDHYTCVAHMPSNSRICVGYLPGDANGDGITNTDDIEALVMNLGADPQTLESWQCDADRSTVCTPLDILRNIQLQSGEEPFDFWSGHQLSDCPNTAP